LEDAKTEYEAAKASGDEEMKRKAMLQLASIYREHNVGIIYLRRILYNFYICIGSTMY
jgi:hypothetical protein